MENAFKDIISNIRETFAKEETALAPASRMLFNLNELRRRGEDESDEAWDENSTNCKHFLPRRVSRTIRKSLPRDKGIDSRNAIQTSVKIILMTPLKGV